MKTSQKTILVADDDTAILESIKLLLGLIDYAVITTTGDDVIELIKKHSPNVILLDVWMGILDGKEVCKKIKADKTISEIPVLMVSASTDIRTTFGENGAIDYLEKPFDIDLLLEKIQKYS